LGQLVPEAQVRAPLSTCGAPPRYVHNPEVGPKKKSGSDRPKGVFDREYTALAARVAAEAFP